MKKTIVFFLLFGVLLSAPFGWAQTEALNVSGPPETKVTYQPLEEGRLMVSVTDAGEKPVLGLDREHFIIQQGSKNAKILSVDPLETNKEIALNIILVVDNSASMKMRKAIEPLSRALDAFYRRLRPIDTVSAVVFDESDTIAVDGHPLHAKVLQTTDVERLRRFVGDSLSGGLTEGTYLHDAVRVGLDQVRKMPEKNNTCMVIFSDGEDINSVVDEDDLKGAASGHDDLMVFAIDYMPKAGINSFLQAFSSGHNGRAWKAASADELLPVFEEFSSILLHRYVVAYRFLEAPRGSLAFTAPQITIEEVTTIDSAPLLNHIYFETGQTELPQRYRLFEGKEATQGFDEKNLTDAMEKYRNVLNIVGRRLQQNPEATIRLVGCNSNTGVEQGRSDLSRSRAEAVRAYLRYIWDIDPQRIAVEHRNLPAAPSTSRNAEGRAENQRVEIYSDHAAILDTVDSAYVQKVSDAEQLRIEPHIESEAGIADWEVRLVCGDRELKTIQGNGALPGEWTVPLEGALLEDISACDRVGMRMMATDHEANELNTKESAALPVNFVQRTEQMSKVQGYKVKEQYALILFDYDSDAIKAHNKAIVERIIARMKEVPDALVSIVGHTDIIGEEEYNIKLSERRSKAVRRSIVEVTPSVVDRLYVSGVGPRDPLYDNDLPEGRSLNRTVTITLEYLQK